MTVRDSYWSILNTRVLVSAVAVCADPSNMATSHARRAAFICAGAEVHAAADGEPGSVVQPQSPEAHNEQKSKSSWWTQSFK